MTFGHSVTIDGSLDDWLVTDRIGDSSTAGYQIYSTADNGDFVFALKAPVAIGANRTVWFDTDGLGSTSYANNDPAVVQFAARLIRVPNLLATDFVL